MTVRILYVDESHDAETFCLSALMIRHQDCRECFRQVRQHREILKEQYGVYLRKEIHAKKLVGGRGRISDRMIGKWERSMIFRGLLRLVAALPGVRLFNICLEKSGRSDPQIDAWERLLNRVERTLLYFEEEELPRRRALVNELDGRVSEEVQAEIEQRLMAFAPRALIVADQGREPEIVRIFRKMHVFNPIPSAFGGWGGQKHQNIPIERMIEDPIFKESHRSYFVQLADCVAFALLKREVPPTANIKKYGIDKMFEEALAPICYRKAARNDPLGIVRR